MPIKRELEVEFTKSLSSKTSEVENEIFPSNDFYNRYYGIFLTLVCVFCRSIMSLIVKLLTDYHPMQILIIRGVSQAVFNAILAYQLKLAVIGESGQRLYLFLRAITGTITAVTWYNGLSMLPLSDATTILNISPILVFILAFFFLGEPITIARITAGLFVLIGVIFVTKPEFIFHNLKQKTNYIGFLYVFIAAITTAITTILLSKLKKTHSVIIILWYSILMTIVSFIILYASSNKIKWPNNFKSYFLFVVMSITSILQQETFTMALKHESAGIVSVCLTLVIVLAYFWDMVLFGLSFHWTSVVGSILVITAVLIATAIKIYGDNFIC